MVTVMCLAIPARIVSINGENAEADIGGIRKTIGLMLTPNVKVGDYVLLHTGYSIGIVDANEAQETLALFKELAEVSEIR